MKRSSHHLRTPPQMSCTLCKATFWTKAIVYLERRLAKSRLLTLFLYTRDRIRLSYPIRSQDDMCRGCITAYCLNWCTEPWIVNSGAHPKPLGERLNRKCSVPARGGKEDLQYHCSQFGRILTQALGCAVPLLCPRCDRPLSVAIQLGWV